MADTLRDGRAVHLVSGYLSGIDRWSPHAARLGLSRRYAVAMESFRTYEVDAVFDALLYGALIRAVARAVTADSFRVEADDDFRHAVLDFKTLGTRLAALDKGDEPPMRIIMYAAATPMVVAEIEAYVRIGGPAPYHDTYTAAFYCTQASVSSVELAVRQACIGTNAHITSESQGEPTAPRGA